VSRVQFVADEQGAQARQLVASKQPHDDSGILEAVALYLERVARDIEQTGEAVIVVED